MTLTVLTDAQIRGLLESLTLQEAEGFRKAMERALHEYSTGSNSNFEDGIVEGSSGGGVSSNAMQQTTHQPPRTSSRTPATGATSLFMPSTSSLGVGVKVVTLMAPDAPGASTSSQPNKAQTQPNQQNSRVSTRPTGGITLFSPTGEPLGLLHARTLTAFRTALASMTLLVRRSSARNMVVFGAGEQAYWHLRLALLWRGGGVKEVTLVDPRSHAGGGRSPCSSEALISRLLSIPFPTKESEGWAGTKFSLLRRSHDDEQDEEEELEDYDVRLAKKLRKSNVIITTTPSTAPLFPPEILTNHAGRKRGRLVVAIGSYQPHMMELPPEILLQATKRGSRRHFHKHAVEGGVVVVDTIDGAMEEAGEIRVAGLDPGRLVELGELLMLSRTFCGPASTNTTLESASSSSSSSEGPGEDGDDGRTHCSECSGDAHAAEDGETTPSAPDAPGTDAKKGGAKFSFLRKTRLTKKGARSSRSGSGSSSRPKERNESKEVEEEDEMARWLREGNVIYKSVGIGVMDLAVGMHIVGFAKEKGVGIHVEGF